MFPLYDSTPRRTTPYVNYAIIALNVYLFWLAISSGNFEQFVTQHAFIPSQFHLTDLSSYLPIVTSLFIHGGFFHILSNMWFLHIFGDNVEDRLGHIPYLLFYLVGGIVATLAQYFFSPNSSIAIIGASGAISAVAGAYFMFYRHSSVKSIVFLFVIITFINVPVWLFLGYWFVIQLLSGIGQLGAVGVQDGGVAWFAHIGGFLFGFLYAQMLKKNPQSEKGEMV